MRWLSLDRRMRSAVLIGAFALIAFAACSNAPSHPIIYTISPSSQSQSAEITIYGDHFGSSNIGAFVSIGGACAQVVEWGNSRIRVRVPTGIGTGNVIVVVVVRGAASNGATLFVSGANLPAEQNQQGCYVAPPGEDLEPPQDQLSDQLDTPETEIPDAGTCAPGMKRVCGSSVGECRQGEQLCDESGVWGECLGETPPSKELCDGKDNDCDGEVDEECPCKDGQVQACAAGKGECAFGQQVCQNGAWGACVGPEPQPEVCDGKDNDCDGVIDNGVTNACGKCGPLPKELCDGIDNNCNGVIDENCTCEAGQTRECGSGVGECKKGSQVCSAGAWGPCLGAIEPGTEVCDGKDNDCDGIIDNGCACTFPSSEKCGIDVGACKSGVRECLPNGIWGDCKGAITPTPEICDDGVDNDCNGQIDEACKCKPGQVRKCGSDVGQCKSGEQVCGQDGEWGSCFGEVTPKDEVCDGLDNNCDGEIDEGCECKDGEKRQCGSDVGLCKKGVQTCAAGKWGLCLGGVEPTPEVCDGQDNNCDGKIDEGVTNACGTCGPLPAEICDGLDNNCNGQIDEDCLCIPGTQQPCGTNVGACKPGVQTCQASGKWGTCVGAIGPTPEVCDGIDNDCDGVVDNGVTNRCGKCGPLPVEVCDGIDNDCNGVIDEGCQCKAGESRQCGSDVGECKFGKQTCNSNGTWGSCLGGVLPSQEVCDGKDNDCDGVIDNGVTNACGTCGTVPTEVCDGKDNNCNGLVDEGCTCTPGTTQKCGVDQGECKSGTQTCLSSGVWGLCEGAIFPTAEVCGDNKDNNCNGQVDEGCLCKPGETRVCGSDVGECRLGKEICQANGTWSPCVGQIGPSTELCDGKDNDCDGQVDNDCKCTPGEKQLCGSNVGECKQGTTTCGNDGKFGPCIGEVGPQPEVCDGKDNNCNGQIDEGVKNLCGTCGPAPQEVCDGKDNNCDGVVDEGCDCTAGNKRVCGTNVGECAFGSQTCGSDGKWGACLGGKNPTPEVCDGKDNNCNGQTDEGLLNACGTCGPTPPEVCDGIDNNCDGVVDEGCDCKVGQVRLCGSSVGTCIQGQQFCDLSGKWSACIGGKGPEPEVCDGADNNCDGLIDEGVTNLCGTCGPAPVEVCDGKDNNCDGTIDEGCECTPGQTRSCGSNVGECKQGTQICGDDGTWSACVGGVSPVTEICDGKDNNCDGKVDEGLLNACGTCGPTPQEICDGKDNNCNGQVDEGCECIAGQKRVCGPAPVGECKQGAQVCQADGKWGACVGAVGPQPEVCDGKDNNCDGRTDEGLLNACGKCGPLPPEICDGKDNDCDGQVDEGCPCSSGQVRPCGKNVGICTTGVQICVGGSWGTCLGATLPTTEVCDGLDNNCNGKIDEGLTNACGTCGPTPKEICGDGIDNNCNGQIDEGCGCKPGETQSCGSDVGTCKKGTQTCQNDGTWGACVGGVGPKPEVCDGLDNDCNGVIDNGVKNACGGCGPVPKEICGDGIDNNCNRAIDEGCPCTLFDFHTCGPTAGICSPGIQVCLTGVWGNCIGGQPPATEVCGDGLDNDCDGKVDEKDECP